ncbi:hypothetical protein D3C80_1544250 [compost metagenome]
MRPKPLSPRATSSWRSASRRNAWRTRTSWKGALARFRLKPVNDVLGEAYRRRRGSALSKALCSACTPLATSTCPARKAAARETWSLNSMISSSSA